MFRSVSIPFLFNHYGKMDPPSIWFIVIDDHVYQEDHHVESFKCISGEKSRFLDKNVPGCVYIQVMFLHAH